MKTKINLLSFIFFMVLSVNLFAENSFSFDSVFTMYNSERGKKEALNDWNNKKSVILKSGDGKYWGNCFLDRETGLTISFLGDNLLPGMEDYMAAYNSQTQALIKANGQPSFAKKKFYPAICNMMLYVDENKNNIKQLSKKIEYKYIEYSFKFCDSTIIDTESDTTYVVNILKTPSFSHQFLEANEPNAVYFLKGPQKSKVLYVFYRSEFTPFQWSIECIDMITGRIINHKNGNFEYLKHNKAM